MPSAQVSEPYTYGTNETHYHSITMHPEDPEDPYPENYAVYGAADEAEAFLAYVPMEFVDKYIEAIMTSDDFETWDYCEDEENESFTVWNSDGTALWTTSIDISYCYTNIALKIKPLVVEGVEYHPVFVAGASIFDAYTETYDEETEAYVYTYIGSTFNKVTVAELAEDGSYIVPVPRVLGYSSTVRVPEGYSIRDNTYIVIAYKDYDENLIYKIQPIGIEQYYPDQDE